MVRPPPTLRTGRSGCGDRHQRSRPLPFGNVQAPPVYSDPPAPAISPAVAPPVAPPPAGVIPPVPIGPATVVPSLPPNTFAPAVPIVTPGAATPITTTVAYGREYLRVTPERLVAPVGTEILLKAGICGADGYLIANERVDWSIARNGVGQFTDMGIRNSSQLFSWWEAPQKVDDWSAVGRTVYVPVSLNATTPDPNDDVQISRGESWVTLTSLAEGTSIVTAYAPNLCGSNQSAATIYWIDAQWIFPASVTVECGKAAHVDHDGHAANQRSTAGRLDRAIHGCQRRVARLRGWKFGGGSDRRVGPGQCRSEPGECRRRGDERRHHDHSSALRRSKRIATSRAWPQRRGNCVDHRTCVRASVGRTGAGDWAGSHPGCTSDVAANAAAPPSTPPTSPNVSPPPRYIPPANATAPTGKPRLEVNVRPTSPEQVAVGEYVGYELTITNRGDGVARHIEVMDQFDQGLRHLNDARNEHVVRNANIRDLAPNESIPVQLSLQVVEAGEHCHDITVSADGADAVKQHRCATGLQSSVQVTIRGPFSRVVGDTAEYSINVQNVGTVPAGKVELVIQLDPAIDPAIEEGAEKLPNGSVLIRLDRDLAPSERRTFRLQGLCRTPSNRACARATVTAAGGASSTDRSACFQILPQNSAAPPAARRRNRLKCGHAPFCASLSRLPAELRSAVALGLHVGVGRNASHVGARAVAERLAGRQIAYCQDVSGLSVGR